MTVEGEEKNFEIDDLFKLVFSSLVDNWYCKNSYYYNSPVSLSYYNWHYDSLDLFEKSNLWRLRNWSARVNSNYKFYLTNC